LTELPAQLPQDLDPFPGSKTFPIKVLGRSKKPVLKKTEQDKMKVIAFAIAIAAYLSQGDLRARREDLESASACAVQRAREEGGMGWRRTTWGRVARRRSPCPSMRSPTL
jgi:hypothetical protein